MRELSGSVIFYVKFGASPTRVPRMAAKILIVRGLICGVMIFLRRW